MSALRSLFLLVALALAGTLPQSGQALAQQNSLIGTWRTTTPTSITYFQFRPDGIVTMSFYKQGNERYGRGALVFSEFGSYRFVAGVLDYVFTRYSGGTIVPPDLNRPRRVQIQFQGPNAFMTSDGAYYVREL